LGNTASTSAGRQSQFTAAGCCQHSDPLHAPAAGPVFSAPSGKIYVAQMEGAVRNPKSDLLISFSFQVQKWNNYVSLFTSDLQSEGSSKAKRPAFRWAFCF
jgi:hypothetical protein